LEHQSGGSSEHLFIGDLVVPTCSVGSESVRVGLKFQNIHLNYQNARPHPNVFLCRLRSLQI
jgi:hypothetical protein